MGGREGGGGPHVFTVGLCHVVQVIIRMYSLKGPGYTYSLKGPVIQTVTGKTLKESQSVLRQGQLLLSTCVALVTFGGASTFIMPTFC